MNRRNELLGELSIDRDPPPKTTRGRAPWIIAVAVLALTVAGLLIGKHRGGPLEVRAVTATRSAGSSGSSVLDASGYVIARRQATVSSKLTGKVTEVLIEEGMAVREGQVLARIDDSLPRAQLALALAQLASAEAGLAEVQAQLEEARRQHLRTRELAAKRLVSQSVLDSTQATLSTLSARLERARRDVTVAQRNVDLQQQQVDDTVVRAPFDGIVTVKAAQPGEMISPISAGGGFTRTGIGTVVDMDSLEIEVDVNENFINRVQAGQPAEARLNAYPERVIPARVIAIVPTADRQKATVRVRVAIEQRDARILPEMGVRVAFLDAEPDPPAAEPVVSAPRSAILERDGQAVVFVIRDGRVERRAVTLGERRGDRVEIRGGLRGGERLAASALELLDDGDPVKISAQ